MNTVTWKCPSSREMSASAGILDLLYASSHKSKSNRFEPDSCLALKSEVIPLKYMKELHKCKPSSFGMKSLVNAAA